jgi:hypothetical protein
MPLRRRAIRADEPGPGRRVIAKSAQDGLLTAILTWIPTEIVATYKVIMGGISIEYTGFRFGISLLVLILTPFWTAYATADKKENVAWRQVILATIAFPCRVSAIQSDIMLQMFAQWQLWMGSVVLAVGTLALSPLDFFLKKAGVRQN